MFRELLLGMFFGTLTGITPALHVNTLAMVMGSFKIHEFNFVILVFTMGLTHTFLDSIPSTFLGVPEEDTALTVLPAHRLVLEGKALEVINISITASLLSLFLAIPLIPLYSHLVSHYSPSIGKAFVFVMFLILIFTERGIKRIYALVIFFLSGILGLLIDYLPLREPYFHVFVGLFGMPALLQALNSSFEIGDGNIEMDKTNFLKSSFLGTLFGMLASLLPTFTSSQAALIGSFVSKDERSFLTIAFSANTTNLFFSLLNFYFTGRTRNGILITIKDNYPILSREELVFLLLSSFLVGTIIYTYGLFLARTFGKIIQRFNYKALSICIISGIFLFSFYLDSVLGIAVLVTSSLIGLLAVNLGVKRTNCMGVLMLKIMIK